MTTTPPTRRLAAVVIAATMPLLAAACGAGSNPGAVTVGPDGSTVTTAPPAGGGSKGAASKGAASKGVQPASTLKVVIKNFAFSPDSFTVAPGATIEVTNEDPLAHTFTDQANQAIFNTGDIGPGQTKTVTAPTKPGRYPFYCLIHVYMTGVMTVS